MTAKIVHDQLSQLVPGLPSAVSVDAKLLCQWLIRSPAAGGYGLANKWDPTAENVADVVDALADNDTAMARASWWPSPAVSATFTLRLSPSAYVFGADTVHGGRVCTLPVTDSELAGQAPAGNLEAAVAALGYVADLIDRAWRRTASSLWTLPDVSTPAVTSGLFTASCLHLLNALRGMPTDEYVVPASPVAALSYNELRAGSLFVANAHQSRIADETFEGYRRWCDEVGGEPLLVGEVLRRFPHTSLAVVGDWIRRDQQLTVSAEDDS